ncbi:MAG: hypothetical protein LAO78_01860 [Acidobacteriia bacterium]|nr:hypothetical protein [Terriglobia bacterium]
MSRLEKTAAAAMVVSFLLLVGVTTRSFVLSRRPDPATVPLVKIGEAVRLPGFTPGSAKLTFVIVLSSQCAYCLHDLPLYRRLSAARSSSGGMMHLIAVLPEKTAVASAFLGSSGVDTDNVLSMAPLELGVKMVPTLLLLDENGKLERYWVGEMNQEHEREVLAALTASCRACRLPATYMQ